MNNAIGRYSMGLLVPLLLAGEAVRSETLLTARLDGAPIMQTIQPGERAGTLSLCGYGTAGLDLRIDHLEAVNQDYREDFESSPLGASLPSGWVVRRGEASVWSIEKQNENSFLRLRKQTEAGDYFRIVYEPGGHKPAWPSPYSFALDVTPTNWGDRDQPFFAGCGGADESAYQAYKIEYLQNSGYLRLRDNSENLCMYTYSWPTGETHRLEIDCVPAEAPDVPSGALKMMTYNIHLARMGDPAEDTYDLVRNVIQEENPGVLGLQETTEELTRRLASDLGMQAYFQRRSIFSSDGSAILSRYPLLETEVRNQPSELLNPRIALRAAISIGGTRYQCFNVHFDHDTESTRIDQANDILQWAGAFPGPRVILGDFNSRPNSQPFNILEAAYDDANRRHGIACGGQNTVSNPTPTVEIDHLFLSGELTAFKAYVSSASDVPIASDHRPAVAWIGSGTRTIQIEVRIGGRLCLSAQDTVLDDPNAYTQGSFVLVTSGSGSEETEILADDVRIAGPESYTEDFNGLTPGQIPTDWRMLYRSANFAGTGGSVQDGDNICWRQRSLGYVKYDYAPRPYPKWREYAAAARIKTVRLPQGGKWRLCLYNYPYHDTGYDTYRIEVNADGKVYLRKGSQALDSGTWEEFGLNPSEWTEYEIDTRPTDVSGWRSY
jgi:endonuclease/exonuclease/phosphatase family metal-dependent hydrolase